MLWYVNGDLLPAEKARLSVDDRGFLHGLGLFETILVYEGRPALLKHHLERLEASARELGLQMPVDWEPVKAVEAVIRAGNIVHGAIRLTVTAGPEGGSPGVVVAPRPHHPHHAEDCRRGWRASLIPWRRYPQNPIYRHKTLNFAENMLARRWAHSSGYDEGLFENTDGHITEGTVTNLFVFDNGNRLCTPPVKDGLLPGVVRRVVLELARGNGIPAIETSLLPEDLFHIREAFLTNSLLGIMPLVKIEGHTLGDGLPGPLTSFIHRLYMDLLSKHSCSLQ
ncbi:MAG: aminotransferase class IV [Desulfotomaculaceae bacterium]